MRKSRLSTEKRLQLNNHFISGSSARFAAKEAGVNFKTAAYYFHRLRQIIASSPRGIGVPLKMDKRFFKKIPPENPEQGPIFGVIYFKKELYIEVLWSAFTKSSGGIYMPDSIIFPAKYKLSNVWNVSDFKHVWVNQSMEFEKKAKGRPEIEKFWGQTKHHLGKFNGIPRKHISLYMKECQWRFNYSDPKNQLNYLNNVNFSFFKDE